MRGAETAEERAVHARRLPAVLERLRHDGAAVTVALTGDRARLREELAPVAAVRVLPVALTPSPRGGAFVPRAVPALRRLVDELAPDVVEGDEPIPALACAAAARRAGPPVIYRRHHESGRRRLHMMSRLATRLADYTSVSNERLRDRLVDGDGIAADRVLVVGSGALEPRTVGGDERAALRSRLGLSPRDKVVAVVSRLREEKGIDVLVAALRHFPRGAVSVVVVGSGPEREALARAAAASSCTVHLVGHQDDVAPWMAISDVVAIPSRREAFGRTTVEAMAAGLPIVASRVGGLTVAIEDGVTGVLVAPEDPGALAVALLRVLGDPLLAGKMGAAGRGRFESHYTIDHMARSWRAAWDAAVASGARP